MDSICTNLMLLLCIHDSMHVGQRPRASPTEQERRGLLALTTKTRSSCFTQRILATCSSRFTSGEMRMVKDGIGYQYYLREQRLARSCPSLLLL